MDGISAEWATCISCRSFKGICRQGHLQATEAGCYFNVFFI